MVQLRVSALRSVDLGVTDVAANAEFYSTIWQLERVGGENGSVYLRGTGPTHHILALHEARTAAILKVTFQALDGQTIDALHARAKGLGVDGLKEPGSVHEPGGGYGFEFSDREGRLLRIVADDEIHADATDTPDHPTKLSHAVFNSAEVEISTRYYSDVLGFKLSDRTRIMDFIRCNRDHHSIAFARA